MFLKEALNIRAPFVGGGKLYIVIKIEYVVFHN